MFLKNLKLGMKIGAGFAALLVIACFLGGLAIVKMGGVQDESTKLAEEFIPEVEVASNIERYSLQTMYAMRGYALSEDETYLKEGMKNLDQVDQYLADAKDLANSSTSLVKLKEAVDKVQTQANEYRRLADTTVEKVGVLNENRATLDKAAENYMDNCYEFLAGQNEAFQRDLAERQKKIELVTDIVSIGSTVRVTNFKSQATGDPKMMEEAISKLGEVNEKTTELRKITKLAEDIERIDQTEAAAKSYKEAMTAFLAEFKKGSSANSGLLDDYRSQMDASAAKYVQNCEAFLEAQQQALTKDMTERNQKINLVNDIIDAGNACRLATWRSQAQRDPELIREADKKFAEMGTLFADLRKITRLKEDLARIDNTETAAKNYRTGMNNLLTAWLDLQEVGKQRGAAADVVLAGAQETAQAGMEQTISIADQAVASLKTASRTMLIGLVIALIIGIFLAVVITMGIVKPVGMGVTFAQAVADGDLTQQIQLDQKDEIGQLALALNGMSANLNNVMQSISEAAEQVASNSEELSASAQNLSSGASEQAASLEETSASIEELTASVQTNAQNSTRADEIASQAAQDAENGGAAVTETVEAMKKIAEQIGIVDDIADQTNLLALNAAIEAARAGEMGKGFAVVAVEVRKLAERSQEAAKEISALANDSVQRAERAGQLIQKVVPDIQETARLVQEISAACSEQASGADQITKAVGQLDQVTQQNSATSEEAAAASEELSAQAQNMQALVSQFKISGNGNGQKITKLQQKKETPALAAPAAQEDETAF